MGEHDEAGDPAGGAADCGIEALGELIDSALSIARVTPDAEVLVYMLDLARIEVRVIAGRL